MVLVTANQIDEAESEFGVRIGIALVAFCMANFVPRAVFPPYHRGHTDSMTPPQVRLGGTSLTRPPLSIERGVNQSHTFCSVGRSAHCADRWLGHDVFA
jgi:hypothetical protein